MTRRIPTKVRKRLRLAAGDRCGYCQCPQHLVWDQHEIDHIVPLCLGGTDDESNLWLACAVCNSFKQARIEVKSPVSGDMIRLFNPRTQLWYEHFRWADGGARIEGITAIGAATVKALRLNEQHLVSVRKTWLASGLWQPER